MLEVVDLFREKNTVDELGLGVVRDAFANAFFPGTSTLHSRARYWFFIPWLFLQLEREKTSSANADSRARRLQADLVKALEAGGENEGVIGIEARDKVLRPPAILYWAGLERHGIRTVVGSMGRYFASLDRYYVTAGHRRSEGDETELIDAGRRNWHPHLPEPPSDWLARSTFTLGYAEADYLRERFTTGAPRSYLAWGLHHPASLGKLNFPWEHPRLHDAPSDLRELIEDARRFSLLLFGAVLAYNLAMAERARDTGLRDGELADDYRARYADWAAKMIEPELATLRAWDRDAFWLRVAALSPGSVLPVRAFSDQFIARALADPGSAADDPNIRQLIASRELRMKGGLARLHNQRALERWGGSSGVGALSYRWAQGRTLLQDVAAGLKQDPADA
jgi:hypothetical protein